MTYRHPQIFNIPSEKPFLQALAEGLLRRYFRADDPLGFARLTIYLPTRRATRALGEHLLDAAQAQGLARALALPAIHPLGDVDEDEALFEGDENALHIPPAFAPLRRRLLLMQLVRRFRAAREGHDGLSAAQALKLATALERLLDHAETQGVSLEGLPNLVTGDLAKHWEEVVAFLGIVTQHWPALQEAEGAIGGAARRNALMASLTQRLTQTPPDAPVIAAGSTGTIPSTAALLAAISRAPQGAVILPGLDQALDEKAWQSVDASHPQGALKGLLETLGVERADVKDWAHTVEKPSARVRIFNEALRPWAATGAWREESASLARLLEKDAPQGLYVSLLEAPHQGAEADAIALIMRETLERPGETAALITPDRALARAVCTALMRWNISVDDSAGEPLHLAPVAVFFRLLIDAAAQGLAPVALLALLKHPLTRLGLPAAQIRMAARALERAVLRGPRPLAGCEGLRAALSDARQPDSVEAIENLITRLERVTSPLIEAMSATTPVSFAALAQLHLEAGEALARLPDDEDRHSLWSGDAGEALADLFEDMLSQRDLLPERPPSDYPSFFDVMMTGRMVRPRFGRHPRLFIWGALEARLQKCDVAILGSLNDGVWPAEAPPDPWLSRGMAASLKLPLPEQRLGLAAHDFVQIAGQARRVYLTRARKVDGAPTIPSRWLVRLETLLKGVGALEQLAPAAPWLGYAEALDRPQEYLGSVRPPAPAPPVSARPRKLSATRIVTWLRDPYAIYARYVLGLKPLDALDLEADARLRGIIVHEVVEAMARQKIDPQADTALAHILALGEEVFARARIAPAIASFWRPRFQTSAQWLLSVEQGWRKAGEHPLSVEVEGELSLEGPQGAFTLTARADRIDASADGSLIIADFKTGVPPTASQIESCIEPQLPLEAAIAAVGGFKAIPQGPVRALRVVRLMAREHKLNDDVGGVDEIAQRAVGYLKDLIARYDDPSMVYRSRVMVHKQSQAGDYDHLARVKEWSAGDAEGDE